MPSRFGTHGVVFVGRRLEADPASGVDVGQLVGGGDQNFFRVTSIRGAGGVVHEPGEAVRSKLLWCQQHVSFSVRADSDSDETGKKGEERQRHY